MAAEITVWSTDKQPSQLSLFLTETFYGDFIFDTIILVYYGLVENSVSICKVSMDLHVNIPVHVTLHNRIYDLMTGIHLAFKLDYMYKEKGALTLTVWFEIL